MSDYLEFKHTINLSKIYEKWVIELLDDFWNIYYPGVPRRGSATESKCRTIEQSIRKRISSSSLYNYFNEKGSPPADGTKGIMSYFILSDWKEKHPQHLKNTQIDFNEEGLSKNDYATKFLMVYYQLKSEQNQSKEIASANQALEFDNIPERLFDRQTKGILGIFLGAIILLLLFFFNQGLSMPEGIPLETFKNQALQSLRSMDELFMISILHVLTMVLLVIIYLMPEGSKKTIDALPEGIVKSSMKQFNRGWLGIWIGWILLYIWMSIKWLKEKQLIEQGIWEIYQRFSVYSWAVADLLNVVSTFFFFYLFLVLDMQSVKTQDMPNRNARFQKAIIHFGIVLTIVLACSVTDRFINFGAWEGVGILLYSLLTSISMLYFFGRLDSHFFNIKRSLLAPLYLYAIIQVNWNNLHSADFALQALAMFFLAFLLKIYLFLIVIRWIRNGDFERYFKQINSLE